MRFALLALALVVVLAVPARADEEWCFPSQGPVLPSGTIVPPRARIAFRTDGGHEKDPLTATIDGTPVKVTRSTVVASPFFLVVATIDSDRTGELAVSFAGLPALHYTVASFGPPKEIPGAVSRAMEQRNFDAEVFHGLAIRLPEGTPAVLATVKHRPSEDLPWKLIQVPLYTPPGESRPVIRIGQFECESNANLDVLARGFDLDVTVMLADGSTVPVAVAKHMAMPEPLPPQPRPKNARR